MDTFTHEPIIVNILESDGKFKVVKTILFIGDVPSKVYSALKSFLGGRPAQPILKKFYSKNWMEKIHKLVKHGIRIKGGQIDGSQPDEPETNDDEFNFDKPVQLDQSSIDEPNDPNELDIKSPDEANEANEPKERIVDFIKEETIDLTDLERLTQTPAEEIEVDTDIILVTEIYAYPHDKIWDLKEKIYAVSGVLPIYQHLWVEHQDIQHQCSYKVFSSGKRIPISAYNLLDHGADDTKNTSSTSALQKIGNIPIDMQFYDDKFLIKIEALDTFEILADINKRYGTTEFNLLSIKNFISDEVRAQYKSILKNDSYQIDMIYYGFVILYYPVFTHDVFVNWVKDGDNALVSQFPDLAPPRKDISDKYRLETNITQQAEILDLPENRQYLKLIEDNIKLSIVSSMIKVLKMGSSKETIIYLRNLFDEYALSETVDYVKTVLLVNNKKATFRKAYNKNPLVSYYDSFNILHHAYDRIPIGAIVFRIRLNPATTECMYLILYQNGNYEIKANWREDLGFGFDEIFRTTTAFVNPIVHTINKMGSKVLYYNKQLTEITRNNSKFSEIGMAIFWNYNFSDVQFKILKGMFEEFRKAGIVETRMLERNEAEYYFIKGMYQYDAARLDKTIVANNYYEYLSNGIVKQKWSTVFTNTRVTRLVHRSADVKLEISGIRENEYDIFNHYVFVIFFMFLMENKKQKISFQPTSGPRKKTLVDNKEQDPELYNTRKIYKTQFIYSRACQKPYQPRILNDSQYESLTTDQKAKAVRYWNFTRKIPVWYHCPNPRFPYIKFMVNKHPREYCIPCCKITDIPDRSEDPNRIIHDTCLKEHKWTGKKTTITLGSRYIMSYGKEIELDRLSRLPEKTLEPLFYDTYVSNGEAMDQECADNITNGYYLYGVPQNLPAVPNVGIFYCLCKALNYSPQEFITQIKQRIRSDPQQFKIIMNGEIVHLFPSIKELLNALDELSNCKNDIIRHMGERWNQLLESIANIYFAINVIKFEDTESSGSLSNQSSEGQRCRLIIPNRLSNIDDFIPENHQNLIVLYRRKDKIFYPIFQINTEIYFKTKIIDAKLFDSKSDVVGIIQRMARSLYSETRTYDRIDLNIIKKFLSSTKHWKLEKLFINNSNYCYGVLVSRVHRSSSSAGAQHAYIPIPRSFYNDRTNIEYQPFYRGKYPCSYETLDELLNEFNAWVAQISYKMGMVKPNVPRSRPLEERVIPIYPFIKVDNWLMLVNADKDVQKQKAEIIGFAFDSQHYYINPPIATESAVRKSRAKILLLRYDPDDINRSIFEQHPPSKDQRVVNINLSVYRYYEYQLLLMEFMSLFSKQRHTKLRDSINGLILKTNFASQLPDFYIALRKLIEDNDDLRKVISFIDNIVNGEWTKKDLIAHVKETSFKFDNVELDKLLKLPKAQMRAQLVKIANKITIKTDNIEKIIKCPNNERCEFPNIFVVCKDQTSVGYCNSKKLLIEKDRFDKLIDILVQDLLNPLKSRWIFSNVFNDRVISMFKFIQRPFERIDISFE